MSHHLQSVTKFTAVQLLLLHIESFSLGNHRNDIVKQLQEVLPLLPMLAIVQTSFFKIIMDVWLFRCSVRLLISFKYCRVPQWSSSSYCSSKSQHVIKVSNFFITLFLSYRKRLTSLLWVLISY